VAEPADQPADEALPQRYLATRERTVALCAPLAVEDYGVQAMPDASPPKWHLAHTTWFFETFVLKPALPGYREFHPAFEHLFNSYYNGIGQPFPRAERGRLSRPTVAEVRAYRAHVDAAMVKLLRDRHGQCIERTVLGLHHEQQHQELIVTDLKYNFGNNPLHPVYAGAPSADPTDAAALQFVECRGGLVHVGHDARTRHFAFDNEMPRHEVMLRPYRLADRLVTNDEFRAFVDDGGYRRPELWLAEGWARVQAGTLGPAPLYWRTQHDEWFEYRLDGFAPLSAAAPVTHVSFLEADAYARWAGARLPTEAEWEVAAAGVESASVSAGNFAESQRWHPTRAAPAAGLRQLFGDCWEWTSSAYAPYPGYRPTAGTLGEYNGKFMSSQIVLRGGSCATPRSHIRATYRNFFYPADQWQFTGVRLARDES